MLESVTLSRSQFGRFYRSTVPPDIDYLYGYNSPLFHASVAKVRAEDTSSTFYKSQWIALASARTANRIIVQQKVADRLDNDVAEAVLAVNRSDIATFVDGLTAPRRSAKWRHSRRFRSDRLGSSFRSWSLSRQSGGTVR